MNDKNFIEELRQKREEYGVTQTRLVPSRFMRKFICRLRQT